MAAGLWTRAFDVKKASLVGADPAAALTKAEAKEEAGSPGCNEALLPYAELALKTDVMVTNGGYGGVQMALAHAVPLVVAGAKEDKPEVAGRVGAAA